MMFEQKPVDQLYIGGQWTDGSGTDRIAIKDPATLEVIAEVADATAEDGIKAVDCAYKAQPAWAATSPRERAEVLRRTFTLLTEKSDALARLIVRENGKTLAEAKGEMAYAAEFYRWYAEEAVRAIGELSEAPAGGSKILVLHQPVGVAVLVTPWNFPAAMATRKIAPALAAGCSVVLKPSEETPLTALAVAGLMEEAGVPPGVVNVIPASKPGEVVKAMIQDTRVRKVSFTGSTEVGRLLLNLSSERVVNCSMELGGNAPFIVCDDADLDLAIPGAIAAKLRNGGESCIAANRFYVHEAIREEFEARLVKEFKSLKLGHGLEDGVDIGSLINEESQKKVVRLVDEAVAGGAKVKVGGKVPDRPGYFYEPTVLSNVPADASILKTEIFGPVAPIVSFSDMDELVEQANATIHGLAAYLFTRDLAKGLRLSERLETGMIGLNRGFISDPAAPFGGIKQSGLGREGSHDGLLEFMEKKYISTRW